MIRSADSAALASLTPSSEASLRILAAAIVYGTERPFCRFWSDDNGGVLMSAEGVATLHCAALSDEWATFLSMSPDVHTVRTDGAVARELAALWGTAAACGSVMRAASVAPQGETSELPPARLYPLISNVFQEAVPPFDSWYADVHHRMRRGRFHARAVCNKDIALSCAMTVAECHTAVLLGAVATHPTARGRGFASACVCTLTHALESEGKVVYISPKNDSAKRLYEHLGFITCGEWGKVFKGKE